MTEKTPQTLSIRKQATGNALVEYLLPAGLIMCVSFSVLVAIGTGMNFQFGSVKSDAKTKITTTQSQNANHLTQKTAFQPALPYQTTSNNGVSGAAITSNLTTIIQTAGANGGTDVLASTLDEYIKNLKANSNLTPDQINQLSDLANAGHELAKAEKALTDALNSGQGTVTYNGKTYTTADFQSL